MGLLCTNRWFRNKNNRWGDSNMLEIIMLILVIYIGIGALIDSIDNT